METGMYGFVLVFFCVLAQGADCRYCPDSVQNGHWDYGYKDGYRCILRCDVEYEPSGCHVIKTAKTDWERNLPTCQKASLVSVKTIVVVGGGVAAGVAAVVAVPVVLGAAGFGAAGVAAGSVAASLQGPATVAGGWFAVGQSAGAAGLGGVVTSGIFSVATTVTGAAISLISGCEQE